ncbi:hypothetical protein [Aquimarina algiphila]|uniref:Uncharacterized protein n=1 Tax=Aquimarina algiphila TaxID=2047982 RepID=A0A554VIJ7_9FLAO|nr:hypothetical protein [Aquimarina algiphila]TSE07493.1 hypothetical protein FOF46_15710 [Aquimarina algiphila]
MKSNLIRFSVIVFFSMLLVNCDKDESENQTLQSFNVEETELNAKVDNTTEVISDIFLQTYEHEESIVKSPIHPFLPECAMVTIEITDTSKEVIVDFGTEGCEVRSGYILKGKVNMSYTRNVDAMTLVINYTLEDFFVNDIQFSGSRTVTRQKANDNGNPQYIMNMDLVVTFADGTEASRTGTKTREWIEGSFNGNWGDNVFLITGEWATNFKNGNMHSTTIKTPLRREAGCRFLVSGVVDLVRTNYSGSLNYGDGLCDNLAMFTSSDGEEYEIEL